MQFSGLLFVPLLTLTLPISHLNATVYFSIVSFIVGLIIVLILMKPDMKVTPKRDVASAGSIIGWSIAGIFMCYVARAIATVIERNVFNITISSENTEMLMKIMEYAPLFIIITAIIAPILEEIIFRKIIFGTLYGKTNFFIAATISALAFGFIHGEPLLILSYASIGFVLAFLYVKTKSILVPIIVHMSLNSISVIIQFMLGPEQLEKMQNRLEQMQTIFIGG